MIVAERLYRTACVQKCVIGLRQRPTRRHLSGVRMVSAQCIYQLALAARNIGLSLNHRGTVGGTDSNRKQ